MTTGRETSLPQIPAVPALDNSDLTFFLATIKEILEIYQGTKGCAEDKVVRLRDLNSRISDDPYDASLWNRATTIAASKNALRDKIETLNGGSGSSGTYTVVAMGQSNMVGYSGTGGDKATDSRVTVWNGAAWVTADLNNTPFDSNHNNIAFHFAKQLAEKRGCNVKIILEAENGRPISDWVPATGTHYVGMKNQISASATTEVDIILWHQGESDYTRTYAAYGADLNSLVTQLRGESQISNTVPIIMGELLTNGTYSKQNFVYEKIINFCTDNFVTVAKAKFMPHCGSHIHFSGVGLVAIGRGAYHAALEALAGYDSLAEIIVGNARARRHSDQSISHNSWTKIQFNLEDWDLGSNYSTSTYRFTATTQGYYKATGQCMYDELTAGSSVVLISFFKNGTRTGIEDNKVGSTGNYINLQTTGLFHLDIGEYLDMRTFQYSGHTQTLVATGTGETKQWFMVKRVL